jgi:peptidyl-prolyl cis-trans isomerase SurA
MHSRFGLSLLALALGAAPASGELVDRIVAIVDRDVITLSEAEEAQRLAELRTGEEAPPLAETVDRLVENRLVEREVERFGAEPVEESLVDEAEARLRASFATADAFDSALASRGLEEDALRELLRRQLAVSAYLEKRFRALTYVTDDEVASYVDTELLSELPAGSESLVAEHEEEVRRILEERKFNERVEQWVEELKARARIRLYVW